MKKLLIILALAMALPVLPTGCSTPPTERVAAVQTLKVIGAARNTLMITAGQLWRDKKITDAQRDHIIIAHYKFQEAYNIAVDGVQSDLTLASPELMALFQKLAALIPAQT